MEMLICPEWKPSPYLIDGRFRTNPSPAIAGAVGNSKSVGLLSVQPEKPMNFSHVEFKARLSPFSLIFTSSIIVAGFRNSVYPACRYSAQHWP